jgi:hypothetical protein
MKFMHISCLTCALAMPVLAAPPTGAWETVNSDFAAGNWVEILTAGPSGAVGNEIQLAGDSYQLSGAVVTESVLAETGFDFVRYVTTYSGGTLTLRNTEVEPWVNPSDPNATFTVTVNSMEVTEWRFANPMGMPTGETEFSVIVEGVAADDPSVEVVFEAGYTGTPGLDTTVEPNFLFGALEWAEVAVTRPVLSITVDIKPGSAVNPVNLSSRGVIPVAIMGSADFDVSQIDVSSIRLEGVAPVRSTIADLGLEESEDGVMAGDGFADLKLKFKTAQLAAVLKEAARNDRVELTLTAVLLDGTQVQGSDTIRVLKSNRKPVKPVVPQKPHGKK